jgi:tetratricopeptide (TPR) repeat protein
MCVKLGWKLKKVMKQNKKNLKPSTAYTLSNLAIIHAKYRLNPEKEEHHYVSFLLSAIEQYKHKIRHVEPYLDAAQSLLYARKQTMLSSLEPGLAMVVQNQSMLRNKANLAYARLSFHLAKRAIRQKDIQHAMDCIDDALEEFKRLKYLSRPAKQLYIEAIDFKMEHQALDGYMLGIWLSVRKKLCVTYDEKMLHHQHSGHLYFMQDCLKEAISSYSRALYYHQKQMLERDKSIILVHQSLAVCYLSNKQVKKGVPHLETVVDYYQNMFAFDPTFYFDDYLERLIDLAYLYRQSNMFEKADQAYQTCFKHYYQVYSLNKTHSNELKSLLEDMASLYMTYKQNDAKKQIEAVIMQLDL